MKLTLNYEGSEGNMQNCRFPFDHLRTCFFDASFRVTGDAIIPLAVMQVQSKYVARPPTAPSPMLAL